MTPIMLRSPAAIWAATSRQTTGWRSVVLVAVGVAAVDHDARREAGFLHLGSSIGDACSGVIDHFAAAAQDDVAFAVAGGDEDGGLAVLGVAEESVRVRCGEDGVDGDLDVAGGGVLESDGAGDAGDELAVDLALGGARADGAPTDEIRDVLRRNHVEELGAGGDAHLGEIEQQMAREAEAVVDFVGAVEMGIVDQALPADGGARLLKVDAHDDLQVGGEFGDGGFEQGGVFAAALVSWMEQGPTRTSRRGSRCARMRKISRRALKMVADGLLGDGELLFEEDGGRTTLVHWMRTSSMP